MACYIGEYWLAIISYCWCQNVAPKLQSDRVFSQEGTKNSDRVEEYIIPEEQN